MKRLQFAFSMPNGSPIRKEINVTLPRGVRLKDSDFMTRIAFLKEMVVKDMVHREFVFLPLPTLRERNEAHD